MSIPLSFSVGSTLSPKENHAPCDPPGPLLSQMHQMYSNSCVSGGTLIFPSEWRPSPQDDNRFPAPPPGASQVLRGERGEEVDHQRHLCGLLRHRRPHRRPRPGGPRPFFCARGRVPGVRATCGSVCLWYLRNKKAGRMYLINYEFLHLKNCVNL